MLEKYTNVKFLALIVVGTWFLILGLIDSITWFELYAIFVGLRAVEKSSGNAPQMIQGNQLQITLLRLFSRETIGWVIASYLLYTKILTSEFWMYTTMVFVFGNVVSKFELFNLNSLKKALLETKNG